jgi:hypothetical protein
MGDAVQTRLIEMEMLYHILSLAGSRKLSSGAFHKLFRSRRNNSFYLRNLLGRLERENRPCLMALMCRNVTERMRAPRFRRRLQELEKRAEAGGFTIPPKR